MEHLPTSERPAPPAVAPAEPNSALGPESDAELRRRTRAGEVTESSIDQRKAIDRGEHQPAQDAAEDVGAEDETPGEGEEGSQAEPQEQPEEQPEEQEGESEEPEERTDAALEEERRERGE